MPILQDLIAKGNDLLKRVIQVCHKSDYIQGDLASEIKSFHIQGRLLLKKIDKTTFEEYSSLFSKHVEDDYDWVRWNHYIRTELEKCVGTLQAVNDIGIEKALDTSIPNIFISHGKFGPVFKKLEVFIRALGCNPIYDTSEAKQGGHINEHVERLFKEADFYVILSSIETTNDNGDKLPNHNVVIEFDRLVNAHVSELIVLLEKGCEMPSMTQDVIYESFEGECMDNAFTKLASELKSHNLL